MKIQSCACRTDSYEIRSICSTRSLWRYLPRVSTYVQYLLIWSNYFPIFGKRFIERRMLSSVWKRSDVQYLLITKNEIILFEIV